MKGFYTRSEFSLFSSNLNSREYTVDFIICIVATLVSLKSSKVDQGKGDCIQNNVGISCSCRTDMFNYSLGYASVYL